jgi:hypothetical protein
VEIYTVESKASRQSGAYSCGDRYGSFDCRGYWQQKGRGLRGRGLFEEPAEAPKGVTRSAVPSSWLPLTAGGGRDGLVGGGVVPASATHATQNSPRGRPWRWEQKGSGLVGRRCVLRKTTTLDERSTAGVSVAAFG